MHACVVIQAGQAFYLDRTFTVQHRCPTGGLSSIQSLRMDTTEPYSGSISLFNVVYKESVDLEKSLKALEGFT